MALQCPLGTGGSAHKFGSVGTAWGHCPLPTAGGSAGRLQCVATGGPPPGPCSPSARTSRLAQDLLDKGHKGKCHLYSPSKPEQKGQRSKSRGHRIGVRSNKQPVSSLKIRVQRSSSNKQRQGLFCMVSNLGLFSQSKLLQFRWGNVPRKLIQRGFRRVKLIGAQHKRRQS